MVTTARKLLVIEDHEIVVVGLQAALLACESKYALVWAKSLAMALQAIDPSVDAILLDLCLPDVDELNPLSGLRTLYESAQDIPIVIFSANESPALIREALGAGAAGFIPKRTKLGVAVAAIDIVLNGGMYLPPHLISLLTHLTEPEPGDDGSSLAPAGLTLTPRQKSVFDLLLEGRSNKEIARALQLSVGTVKNYVSELLRSTNAKTRSRILAMSNLKPGTSREPQ
jgi:DNA-binding NarL/FixJ family response regulator